MAGPTSFAPIINAAVDIVEESGGQYHVLIIIADGQVFMQLVSPCYGCSCWPWLLNYIVLISIRPMLLVDFLLSYLNTLSS
jgi:hypothetical protein